MPLSPAFLAVLKRGLVFSTIFPSAWANLIETHLDPSVWRRQPLEPAGALHILSSFSRYILVISLIEVRAVLPGIRARSLNGCSEFRQRQGSQDLIHGRGCKRRASELGVTHMYILFGPAENWEISHVCPDKRFFKI